MKKLILSAFLLSALLTGCANSFSQWNATSAGVSRDTPQGERAYSTVVLKRDQQVYLVLMTKDAVGSESGGSNGKEVGSVFAPQQGRELFKWSSDYQSKVVSIGKDKFDLQQGGLFLVEPKERELAVRQMAIDLKSVSAVADATEVGKKIKEITASDRQAAVFFKDY
jgi:predicted small secreted protein